VDTDSPSEVEVARETLRRLAQRKVPPTPDNYRELYFEIRGSADELKPWNALIRDLIAQFERMHGELTQARKREALNHVLEGHPNANILNERLSALVKSWTQAKGASGAASMVPCGNDERAPKAPAPTESAPPAAILATTPAPLAGGVPDTPLRPLLANLLANGIAPVAGDDEALASEARALANILQDTASEASAADFAARLEKLIAHMGWAGEEHRAMRVALLDLLRLIVDNIRELVIDDSWLHGQLSAITETFAGPLSLRMLDIVGQQLRDVIDKQSHLKRDLSEAQARLKEMLAGFVDRLSEVTISTGDYHELLIQSARRISEASSIDELSTVVGELLLETRHAQESTLRAGQELTELRERVDKANLEIARLQNELDTASRLMRHDPLTGALNRKGLDEALMREISTVKRKGSPLCIALLDIDDFKKVNDVHGHSTGDEALCHLTRTVTETLRPQDVVARYGGEEFIILVPRSSEKQMERISEKLCSNIAEAHIAQLPLTVSLGYTLFRPEESSLDFINRADQAMYDAKKKGKNRVCSL
jgi:diguanylate cyclase